MSVDELMPRARQAWAEGARSKNALRKNLRVAWDRADEVFSRLSTEDEQERARKQRERQATLTRLRGRKKSGRTLPVRRQVLPEAPVSPAVVAVPPALTRLIETVSEEVFSGPAAPLPQSPIFATVATPEVLTAPSAEGATEEVVQPQRRPRRVATWPALVVAAPAFVAIWAGWVAIGKMTGFGRINLLPGFGKGWVVDTAITLPVGVEAYAAYAFYVALNPAAPMRARWFAGWSAALAVLLGMGGQTAYHLMNAAHMTAAPWQITTVVSCLPVATFGLVAVLVHMVHTGDDNEKEA